MASRLKRNWPIIVVGLTLLLCLTILTDAIPGLRGPLPDSNVWHWRYDPNFTSRLIWPLLAAALFLLVGWLWVEKSNNRFISMAAIGAISIAVFVLQIALVYADEGAVTRPLIDRTLALNSGGYFSAAAEAEDMSALLRNYPEAMPLFASDHPRTHPPGLVLANWWTIRLAESVPNVAEAGADITIANRCNDLWLLSRPAGVSAALLFWAYLPLMLAALLVWPAYALLKQLGSPETAARLGTLFAAIVPPLLLFAPISDQLYPTLLIVILLLVDKGLRRNQWLAALGAGLLLSLLTFLSIGNGIIALHLAIYTLLLIWQGEISWQQLIKMGSIVASATTVTWLLYLLYAKIFPWEIISVALNQHWELVNSTRIYERWVIYNLVDVLVYAGIPIVVACLWHFSNVRQRRRSKLLAFGGAALMTILLLNVSGSIRGEVARVWTFLIVFLTLPAAALLAEQLERRYVWTMLIAQLMLVVSLGLAWSHIEPVILVVEPAISNAVQRDSIDGRPSLASFGGLAELTAVEVDEAGVSEGQISLTYNWLSTGRSRVPYTVFNHLVDASGQLVAQSDGWSVNGSWPTSCWQVGDTVTDKYLVEVPADIPAGNYALYLGLYDAQLDSRLLLADGHDSFLVTTIRIPAQ